MMRLRVSAAIKARLTQARVAHLATLGKRSPHIIPVCFVFRENSFYTAIDRKPKIISSKELQRVRNIRGDPRVAILIDHYEENWSRLWYILVRGRAELVDESGHEHRRVIRLLRQKYPQYKAGVLSTDAQVIRIRPQTIVSWGMS
jgi:coenzyme F420-0:L-glutamate ligase/coenzyme F420-1:gamma-L-glutamate ligase